MAIKIGIVGCGAIARQVHLPAILKNQKFELTTLIDSNVIIGYDLNKQYKISTSVFDSINEDINCEAAIVSVPPHLHTKICLSLIKNGIHVLCEKPMATSYNDCKKMINASKENKKILHVGMNKEYCPNTIIMNDILSSNYLGKIESFELESGIRSNWNAANPKRYDPKYVLGGVVFENGIHWIYRILRWFGYPEILKYEDDRIDGVEANAIIKCLHQFRGLKVNGEIIFSSDHILANHLSVNGKKRTAKIYDNDDSSVYINEKINGKPFVLKISENLKSVQKNVFETQLEDFALAIIDGNKTKVSSELAANCIKFIEEAYSIRTAIKQPWVLKPLKLRGGIHGN